MQGSFKLNLIPISATNTLSTLVENRTAYTLENCELNVFETHQKAEKVDLVFNDLVLTSMIRGKKVMHLNGSEGFDYLPGESVIVPPNEVMRIDFPEAEEKSPTQCIALAISNDQIRRTLDLLNERYPKVDENEHWEINKSMFHLNNNLELAEIINRFVRISLKDNSQEKDLIANLALRELLIRLMQTQARSFLEANFRILAPSNRFAFIIEYIKNNIREKIEVDYLSNLACMSRASFFRSFKQEFGVSPNEYILIERLKLAKKYLADPSNQVTQVCYMAGFNSLNYFIRVFKKEIGQTPKRYQQLQTNSNY